MILMIRMLAFASGVAATLLMTVAGCGGGPPVGKVTGTVTLDGQPVGLATISFYSEATTKGYVPAGPIDSDGRFHVETKNAEGLLPQPAP